MSSGFRAPTPGQQNGFNISTIFDPALGDLVNNGVIPSISPVAALRGGVPLEPERSINYTAGVVFDTGPFNFSADGAVDPLRQQAGDLAVPQPRSCS